MRCRPPDTRPWSRFHPVVRMSSSYPGSPDDLSRVYGVHLRERVSVDAYGYTTCMGGLLSQYLKTFNFMHTHARTNTRTHASTHATPRTHTFTSRWSIRSSNKPVNYLLTPVRMYVYTMPISVYIVEQRMIGWRWNVYLHLCLMCVCLGLIFLIKYGISRSLLYIHKCTYECIYT
jgi:hypothetical protein